MNHNGRISGSKDSSELGMNDLINIVLGGMAN